MTRMSFAVVLSGLAITAVSANAGTVYLDDNLGQLWAGDPTTATYSYLGTSATAALFGGFTDIDFVGSILYGLSPTGELYTISTSTGQITSDVGPTGVGDGSLVGLAGDTSGTLWAGGTNNVYTLNLGSGAASQVGTGGGGYATEGDLDFDGSGNLWLTSTSPSGGALWQINTTTGVGSFAGQLQDGSGNPYTDVFGVAYDSEYGILYGYDVSGNQFDINTGNPNNSGAGEVLFAETGGGTQDIGGILGAAYIASPEPSTFASAAIGSALILFALYRRRRTNRTV